VSHDGEILSGFGRGSRCGFGNDHCGLHAHHLSSRRFDDVADDGRIVGTIDN